MTANITTPDYVFSSKSWTLPSSYVGNKYVMICGAYATTLDSSTANKSLYIGMAFQDDSIRLWNTGTNSSIQKLAAAIRVGSNLEVNTCSVKLIAISRWK